MSPLFFPTLINLIFKNGLGNRRCLGQFLKSDDRMLVFLLKRPRLQRNIAGTRPNFRCEDKDKRDLKCLRKLLCLEELN